MSQVWPARNVATLMVGYRTMRRTDCALVVLDAHVLDAGVILFVDVLQHIGRLGAVDQFLKAAGNRVGQVDAAVRVVAELAVIGVGRVSSPWPCSFRP